MCQILAHDNVVLSFYMLHICYKSITKQWGTLQKTLAGISNMEETKQTNFKTGWPKGCALVSRSSANGFDSPDRRIFDTSEK